MQQFTDVVQDQYGNALQNVEVRVLQAGRLASIFQDAAGTLPADNPAKTGANGAFSFYGADGDYEIWVGGQKQKTITLGTSGGTTTPSTPTGTAAPTTGTWNAGDFVKNTGISVLGTVGSQYIVKGWTCIAGGTPGTWVEERTTVVVPGTVASTGSGSTVSAAPAPATSSSAGGATGTPYANTVLAESLTGGTFATWATLASSFIPSDAATGGTGALAQDTTAGVVHSATFTGCGAGTYSILIRYLAQTNQDQLVQVDSGTATDTAFPAGAGWQTLTIAGQSLAAGTHTVNVTTNSAYMNIHWIRLVQTSGVTAAPAASPAPAPSTAGNTAYPFGARTDAYLFGTKVTGLSNPAQDAALTPCYDAWKGARVRSAPPFTGRTGTAYAGQTVTTGYYVDDPEYIVQPNPTTGDPGICALTTSEAIAYGMLIVVTFAGYDPNAQAIFDGMSQVARAYPAYSAPQTASANLYLMDYRIGTRSGPAGALIDFSSQGGGWNACDGDLDRARAYLMAHRQWGSTGAINYYQEALNTIGALKAVNFSATGVMWDSWHNVSRTSDYMIGHFRDFKKATNDTFWDSAVTNSLSLLQSVITASSPTAKLPCEWIYDPMGTPVASPGGKIDGPYEGYYGPNAMRVAMRLAMDFVFSNQTGCHDIASNIVMTIKGAAGGNVNATTWQYDLAGNPWQGKLYYEPGQDACTMAGGCVDAAHQAWVNACFTQLTGNFNTNYYAAELTLLSLVLASGNFWRP